MTVLQLVLGLAVLLLTGDSAARRLVPTLTVVDASGRFTATAKQLVAALRKYDAAGADVITWTEVGLLQHQLVLAAWAEKHHWTLYQPKDQPGMAECAILTRDATVRQVKQRAT